MMDKAVVSGEYVTYSHVKTRKTFTITIEFPEEKALEVLNILGAPVADNSNPVAVCLLNEEVKKQPLHTQSDKEEKSEGEKLRILACTMCEKDELFRLYLFQLYPDREEYQTVEDCLYAACWIDSRAELVTDEDAQERFKDLLKNVNQWKTEQQFSDNLSRG